MIQYYKKIIIGITERLHWMFFGHEMSSDMRKFLSNLSVSVVGGVIASGISFIISILLGRLLGPIEYGKYALFITFTSFAGIFISLGMDTSVVKYNIHKNEKNIRDLFSTLTIFFILNSAAWFFLSIIFREKIMQFFSISMSFIILGIIFAVVNSLCLVFENGLKSLNYFVFTNKMRIVQNVTLLLFLFIFLYVFDLFSVKLYILLFILALALSLFVFFIKLRNYIKFIFDRKIFSELFGFSMVSLLGVISGFLIKNGDNLIINHFIGTEALGVYNAYYTLSMVITGQIVTFFVSAYFPALVRSENKILVIKKIDKLAGMIALPWIAVNFIFMIMGIRLYGSAYAIDLKIISLFSFYSLFYLYGILYGYIVLAEQNNGTIRNLYFWWFLTVLMHFSLLIGLSFIVKLNLYIILVAYVIVFGFNVLLNRYFCKKAILENDRIFSKFL